MLCAIGFTAGDPSQGTTATIKVNNFPLVQGPDDLQVQFRSSVTALSKVCDGVVCGVRMLQVLSLLALLVQKYKY
jgi:hypothetical protein